MSEHGLRWRVSSGRWVRLHEGVFLTEPGRDDWTTTAVAAMLAAQSGAVAADAAFRGASAAFLWGLRQRPPERIHLVVPQRRSVRMADPVKVRRSLRWDDLVDDLAYPWRTTLRATVLDVATEGSPLDALSAVAHAVQKSLVTPRELRQEITARGGHRYSRLLKAALADVAEGAESGAEALYIRDVERAHGLPTARRQAGSATGSARRSDNLYAKYDLVVEVDGRLGHETWSDRVRDGRRDREELAHTRVTTRVFFADVAVTPCQTAWQLAAILRSRGWTGSPRPCRRPGCARPPQVFERSQRP